LKELASILYADEAWKETAMTFPTKMTLCLYLLVLYFIGTQLPGVFPH
jgi:hypothetical protein